MSLHLVGLLEALDELTRVCDIIACRNSCLVNLGRVLLVYLQITGCSWVHKLLLEHLDGVRLVRSLRQIPNLNTSIRLLQL